MAYPKAGDTWRSRDKRDDNLTVKVIRVDEWGGIVHIQRFRKTRVKLRRWIRDYEFVSRETLP